MTGTERRVEFACRRVTLLGPFRETTENHAIEAVAGAGTGLTCCQAADLLNAGSTLDRRIDLILARGGIEVLSAVRLGDDSAAKTPSGLWPSDHAGVAAVLALRPR